MLDGAYIKLFRFLRLSTDHFLQEYCNAMDISFTNRLKIGWKIFYIQCFLHAAIETILVVTLDF